MGQKGRKVLLVITVLNIPSLLTRKLAVETSTSTSQWTTFSSEKRFSLTLSGNLEAWFLRQKHHRMKILKIDSSHDFAPYPYSFS